MISLWCTHIAMERSTTFNEDTTYKRTIFNSYVKLDTSNYCSDKDKPKMIPSGNSTQLQKITIFYGKIHYFYGHFPQQTVSLPEGNWQAPPNISFRGKGRLHILRFLLFLPPSSSKTLVTLTQPAKRNDAAGYCICKYSFRISHRYFHIYIYRYTD